MAKTHIRFGFIITKSAGPDAPWRGWREDGFSFRADTLAGAYDMARHMHDQSKHWSAY